MNYRMIGYLLGVILLIESALLLLPTFVALLYSESVAPFLITIAALLLVSLPAIIFRPKKKSIYAREGFITAAAGWILLSAFGALPFVLSGAIPNYINAFFETVSGFTTTGASIFSEVENLPKCVLMWRSFTHWVGGMGVLVFIMAFLPLGGAHNMNIMKAESPGPSVSKIVPKVKTTALILYIIYFAMTFLQFVLLLFGGTNVFDAINISFATAGTGGFGIKNDSIASYSSYVQIVVTVFMFLFSLNFSSYFLLLKGKFKDAINTEMKVFVAIVAIAITVITVDIHKDYGSIGEALKHSSFTVSSIISTTGFSTADFNLWNNLSKTIIIMLMFIGACAGSTGGGIKVSRIIMLVKGVGRELKMLAHPKQVKKISVDSRKVDHEVVRSVNAYIVSYIVIFAASVLLLSFEETDLVTNFTAVAATINNIGPGLEAVGPTANFGHLSILSKLTLTFDMLAGRLELFPMLLLFSPATWRK